MKTLLIDNYDSFTYNLFQLLAEANGDEPLVVRNDGATGRSSPGGSSTTSCSRPGPAGPSETKDFGVCADAIEAADVPLLGVCLGHQGIGILSGGDVVHAPEVMHGRMSAVRHERLAAVRRHPARSSRRSATTRCASPSRCPAELEPLAWTATASSWASRTARARSTACSSIPSRSAPSFGRRLLVNFRDLTASHIRAAGRRRSRAAGPPGGAAPAQRRAPGPAATRGSRSRSGGSTASTTPSRPSSTCSAQERARLLAGLVARSTSAPGSRSSAPRRPAGLGRRPTTSPRRRSASTRQRTTETVRRVDLRVPRPRAAPPARTSPTTCRSTSTAASSATSATSSRPTARATWPSRPRCPTPRSSSPTG